MVQPYEQWADDGAAPRAQHLQCSELTGRSRTGCTNCTGRNDSTDSTDSTHAGRVGVHDAWGGAAAAGRGAACTGAGHGTLARALCGKYLCVLVAAPEPAGTALLLQAASALGVQVAQVPCSLPLTISPYELQHTARLLGRLYDGVACVGVAPELVRRLAGIAEVPVFDTAAAPHAAVQQLAAWLQGSAANCSEGEQQRWLMQARLLHTLS